MGTATTINAAVYLRQSLDRDMTQLAVARQRADCLELCERRGWTPVEYVDNSVSATSGKPRPAYEHMLADIRDGKIGAVVAWDLDRLHRQPIELEHFMQLADDHRLALATVTGEIDLSTDNGRLYARIKGAVARSEVDRKAARQRRAGQQQAERGLPKWKRAFGYREGENGPEPDPTTAPLVKEAYAALLAGTSITDLARTFNGAGAYGLNGKPWTASTMSLFLRKPRNAGLRDYNGELVTVDGKPVVGTWQPLVDAGTWHAAQNVLNAPGRRPGRKTVRRHLLTGLLRCGACGSALSGQWVKQPTGGKPGRPKKGEKKVHPGEKSHAIAYACKSCRGVSVRAENVEPFLYRLIGGRLAMPDAVDLLKAELHDSEEAEALRTEAQTLLARLDEIADAVADGDLTPQQAKRATERVQVKLAEIERLSQDQERLRLFQGLPLGRPEAVDAVKRLSADRYRAVLDALAVVTILPVGKGSRVFRPDRVKVDWR